MSCGARHVNGVANAGLGRLRRPCPARVRCACPVSRGAFTLVEVLVVLVVLMVAAGMIVPRMGGSLARREMREAAARFAATARTVRELAVARGQTLSIQLDLDKGGYGIVMRDTQGRPGEMKIVQASWLKGARWPESVRRMEVRTANGTTLVRGTHRVVFNPDGTSSGAAIRLTGSDERDECRVIIYPRTGRTVVADERTEPLEEQYDMGD